jgi:flagellar biogenesis protein FliO
MLAGVGGKVALAIALALAGTAAARYLQQTRNGWRPGRGRLRVVETAALGQSRAVHLIAVGQRTLLVASTPSQVVMLADVTEERAADLAPVEDTSPPDGFGSLLSSLLARGDSPGGGQPRGGQPRSEQTGRLQAAAQMLRRHAVERGRP